ncbi:MAG: antitoxin, partial [Candidatus Rokuibacteriota bacterium]
MDSERNARLFRNGRNQAIRIPREFELPGTEARLRKEGDALIITPIRERSLLS